MIVKELFRDLSVSNYLNNSKYCEIVVRHQKNNSDNYQNKITKINLQF